MDAGLAIAVLLALAFAVTNGLHDASNAIATLVATRAARPGQAIVLATIFNLVGPFLVGAAVADTIGGIVTVSPSVATEVIGCGLAAAVAWNLTAYWLGLPSSSGHALVGGLVGAALVEGGVHAVNWGGIDGAPGWGLWRLDRPGGFPFWVASRRWWYPAVRRRAASVTRPLGGSATAGQWATSSALAFSHGANDAQKAIGVIAALLLGDGRPTRLRAHLGDVACAVALTAGTALGGWRIIRTVGRRIYRIQPIEGLASRDLVGGCDPRRLAARCARRHRQVVASSVVGIGAGRQRLRHVNWALVRHIGLAWLVTLPASRRSPRRSSGS